MEKHRIRSAEGAMQGGANPAILADLAWIETEMAQLQARAKYLAMNTQALASSGAPLNDQFGPDPVLLPPAPISQGSSVPVSVCISMIDGSTDAPGADLWYEQGCKGLKELQARATVVFRMALLEAGVRAAGGSEAAESMPWRASDGTLLSSLLGDLPSNIAGGDLEERSASRSQAQKALEALAEHA